MNVLSLFDGMSCGQIALKRLGININKYYASEVDKFAIEIAKKNNPEMIHLGDVRFVDTNKLEPIDLLIGGSPCQSFSFAGKKNGMTTKESLEITSLDYYLELKSQNVQFEGQSYLFWEYVRILKEIQEYNPNVKFLLENVVMVKKWEKIITETLGVESVLINSSLVSAQNRPRLYWTNIKIEHELEDLKIKFNDIKIEKDYKVFTLELEPFLSKNYYYYFNNNIIKPIGSQGNRIYFGDKAPCLSVGGSSAIKIFIGFNEGNNKILYRKIDVNECELLQTVPLNYTEGVSNSQRFKMLGNGWTVDVICYLMKGLL